jgi:predicted secreted protein
MAASAGRSVTFTWNSSPVLGVREKGFTANGEPIDITSDDDNGWHTILDVTGEKSVNISLSGVTKDLILRTAWAAEELIAPVTLTYPDGSSITGDFFMASYKEGIPYKDAVTFDVELQSTGPVTFDNGTTP